MVLLPSFDFPPLVGRDERGRLFRFLARARDSEFPTLLKSLASLFGISDHLWRLLPIVLRQ
jgi:hypothetical protein